MNRIKALTVRNIKETVREPLSLVFCVLFPIAMLVMMELIMSGVPKEGATMFEIENFSAGIAVFGYTFTMLFIALGLASDKTSAFMTRISVSPLKPIEYYLSYVFAFLPVCLLQTVLFFACALIFGLKISVGLLVAIVYLIPSMLFYISCGIFIGTVAPSDKAAGPVSSIFICAAGLLGGVWMPVESLGGGFFSVCKALPFFATVKPAASAVKGVYGDIFPYALITLAYTVVLLAASALIYRVNAKK